MNSAIASACFAVGSMRSGANQSATGRTTHRIRPMKMRRGKRTGREMSAPTASAARSSASVGASGARPGNFARVSSNIEIIFGIWQSLGEFRSGTQLSPRSGRLNDGSFCTLQIFNRPFHGLDSETVRHPAINRWAILDRPLRGLAVLEPRHGAFVNNRV